VNWEALGRKRSWVAEGNIIEFVYILRNNSKIIIQDSQFPANIRIEHLPNLSTELYCCTSLLGEIPLRVSVIKIDFHVIKCRFHSFTHRAEPFLRSCQLCSYSRTSQHFMEPEGSLPCSQEPSTCPYPEPDRSNPYHPILSL
jgi:hypothetical protein